MTLAGGHIPKCSAKETQPHKRVLCLYEHIDHTKQPQLPYIFPQINLFLEKDTNQTLFLLVLFQQGSFGYKTFPIRLWEILLCFYKLYLKFASICIEISHITKTYTIICIGAWGGGDFLKYR